MNRLNRLLYILFISLIGFSNCVDSVQESQKIPFDRLFKKNELDFPDNLKMDHLAKISFKERKYILHGLFSKKKSHFKLNAFGDFDTHLFTVTYDGKKIKATIHFEPLKTNHFNAVRVGVDLWRIYVAKDNNSLRLFRQNNTDVLDQKVKLQYNKNNMLTHKLFYTDGLLSYRIQYKEYHDYNGLIVSRVVICDNLKYNYQLKIVTLKASR